MHFHIKTLSSSFLLIFCFFSLNSYRKRSIKIPEYDFATHTRTVRAVEFYPGDIILIEGIMLFWDDRIREQLDYKIYLKLDSDVRFGRRLKRDMDERGRTLNSVFDQYFSTVKPMFDKYVEPKKKYADAIINGDDAHSFIISVENFLNSIQ